MPNWCENSLKLSHPDPEVWAALVKKLEDAERNGDEEYLLQILRPMPLELLEGEGWYDWAVENWGTKWDVELSEQSEPGMWRFMSAWSPPVELYEYLTEQGFAVLAYYYEPGWGFAGVYDDGECVDYEPGDEDAWFVFEELGRDTDDIDWLCWKYEGKYDEDAHFEAKERAEEVQKQALKALDAAAERALVAWVVSERTQR
jgi:hypothetical protein